MSKTALAIHGGAGTILRWRMTPDLEREYRSGLETALTIGWEILQSGGSAVDAVESTIVSLEDFPLFNAGRGSVFTHDGRQEMDAAIMDGSSVRAGAVAAVRNVRNPIKLARLVMTLTEHALLTGDGANEFADQVGIQKESDEYFFTEHRWIQLQEALATGRVLLDHAGDQVSPLSPPPPNSEEVKAAEESLSPVLQQSSVNGPSRGTVGAVALDEAGHMAAATSTGGMTNKKYGRVGDTALIGQGTYADDICAVSCTGHGEYFMLGVTAYDVAARMKYKDLSLAEAALGALERMASIGGDGGLIAVDAEGNITMPFNSQGMYRGSVAEDRPLSVHIYRD